MKSDFMCFENLDKLYDEIVKKQKEDNDEELVIDNTKAHPVKSKQANELGLYDMSGNVWEWCQDEMKDYTEMPIINSYHDIDKNEFDCVCRGGSWSGTKNLCRVLTRNTVKSDTYDVDVGFRLVLEPVSL